MRPCSAYCEPERGLHRFVDYVMANGGSPPGAVGTIRDRGRPCLAPGTRARVVGYEPAFETDEPPPADAPWLTVAVLLTVEVVD